MQQPMYGRSKWGRHIANKIKIKGGNGNALQTKIIIAFP